MSVSRTVIGYTTGSAPPSPSETATISKSERYAQDMEAYLVSLIGFAMAIEAWRNGHAQPYREEDTVALDSRLFPARWVWRPHPTLSALTANLSAGPLDLHRHPLTTPTPTEPLKLGSVGGLLHTMGQALGTNYFERYVGIIKSHCGDDPCGWPSVWNFARVVRNAMAHGGRIHFTSPNAKTVAWRGLSYGPSENDRHILHVDLWPGDLFDLLIEMDAELSLVTGNGPVSE